MKRAALVVALLAVVTTSRPPAVLGATVAAGNSHTVVRTSSGAVYAWGWNTNGQLGIGSTTSTSLPTQITTLSGVTAVAAGASHTLVLKSDATVWAFGSNTSGQLGDGTTMLRAPVNASLILPKTT